MSPTSPELLFRDYNDCCMQANGGASGDAMPEVVDAVLLASRVLVSVSARSLAGVDHDVTLPQYRALVVLASRGVQRPGDLADALGLPPVDGHAAL